MKKDKSLVVVGTIVRLRNLEGRILIQGVLDEFVYGVTVDDFQHPVLPGMITRGSQLSLTVDMLDLELDNQDAFQYLPSIDEL